MILKVHTAQDRTIVAVCDSDIVGKKFEDKGVCLDLSSEFYNGKEADESVVLGAMAQANILNLVGVKAVGLGIRLGYVKKEKVINVLGIPHAQAVLD